MAAPAAVLPTPLVIQKNDSPHTPSKQHSKQCKLAQVKIIMYLKLIV